MLPALFQPALLRFQVLLVWSEDVGLSLLSRSFPKRFVHCFRVVAIDGGRFCESTE